MAEGEDSYDVLSDDCEECPPQMLDPDDVEIFEKHPLPKQPGYVSRIVKEASSLHSF